MHWLFQFRYAGIVFREDIAEI